MTVPAEDYEVTGNSQTSPGTYTVTVTGRGNCKDSAQAEWSIEKKQMTVSAPDIFARYEKGKVYGIKVNVKDPADNYEITYGRTETNISKDFSPALSGPGELTVYFKVTAPGYEDYTGSAKVKVVAAEPVDNNAAFIELSSKFSVTNTSNVVIVTWGKVKGATSYIICGSYCKSTKILKIAEVTKNRYTFTKLNKKSLALTKCMKIYVIAMEDGHELARTKTAHIALRRNPDYTNVKKLSVSPTSTTMTVGKIKPITKHVLLEDSRKKELPLDQHQNTKRFTYASSDKSVADVNSRGEITAVGRGECDIWVYYLNGIGKRIKVTVKAK